LGEITICAPPTQDLGESGALAGVRSGEGSSVRSSSQPAISLIMKAFEVLAYMHYLPLSL